MSSPRQEMNYLEISRLFLYDYKSVKEIQWSQELLAQSSHVYTKTKNVLSGTSEESWRNRRIRICDELISSFDLWQNSSDEKTLKEIAKAKNKKLEKQNSETDNEMISEPAEPKKLSESDLNVIVNRIIEITSKLFREAIHGHNEATINDSLYYELCGSIINIIFDKLQKDDLLNKVIYKLQNMLDGTQSSLDDLRNKELADKETAEKRDNIALALACLRDSKARSKAKDYHLLGTKEFKFSHFQSCQPSEYFRKNLKNLLSGDITYDVFGKNPQEYGEQIKKTREATQKNTGSSISGAITALSSYFKKSSLSTSPTTSSIETPKPQ